MSNQLSNCCKAEMKVITDTDLGSLGTSYYECIKCGKPCDIYVVKTWQEKLNKLVTRYFIPNSSVKWEDIIKFITDLIAQTREETIREVEEGLPKKCKMIHAVRAHSDAGAGHVIGFNDCRQKILDILNKLKK